MRNFEVGDWVTLTGYYIPSNAKELGIKLGDVGRVREIWTNPHNCRHGVNVEMASFHTDILLEDLVKDEEFDEKTMSYQFYESELILSTEVEKEENSILEDE